MKKNSQKCLHAYIICMKSREMLLKKRYYYKGIIFWRQKKKQTKKQSKHFMEQSLHKSTPSGMLWCWNVYWSKKSLRPSTWRLRRGNASNVSKNLPSVPSGNQMFLLVIIIMIIHLSRNEIGHDCLLQPVLPRQARK